MLSRPTEGQTQQDLPESQGARTRGEAWEAACALIGSRSTVSPRRLVAPGPSSDELQSLLQLAAAAPDHGRIVPWRFVIVPPEKRHLLGEAFAQALMDRDANATEVQVEEARSKAHRAPVLLVAVVRLAALGEAIVDAERLVSLGCAVQNILLAAHALGYGAGLTSGQAMQSHRLATLLALSPQEKPVCCVNVGTVVQHKASSRMRPTPDAFTSSL